MEKVLLIAVIATVWGALVGSAYLLRRTAALGRTQSALVITALFATFAALALAWLGLNPAGYAGVFGMLLPYAVSMALALGVFGRRGPQQP
jgi:hypothetical protein